MTATRPPARRTASVSRRPGAISRHQATSHAGCWKGVAPGTRSHNAAHSGRSRSSPSRLAISSISSGATIADRLAARELLVEDEVLVRHPLDREAASRRRAAGRGVDLADALDRPRHLLGVADDEA